MPVETRAGASRATSTWDVVVVGCGPTGGVLANLLGLSGLRVLVVERDVDVYPIPRATHVDEETLRNLQTTGLLDRLLPHTARFGTFRVLDAAGRVLVQDVVADAAGTSGHEGSCFFDQPAFERVFRDGLARFPNVELRTGAWVAALADDGDEVRVTLALGDDVTEVVRARWVVGCDGAHSLCRRHVAPELEELAPARRWLIVDTILRRDDAPIPDGFCYHLDPERLTLYAHGFGRNRRWEFRLPDDGSTPDETTVRGWLSRYVPLDAVEITRIAAYAHRSLVARTWRRGRVLLAGDAAHLMPPFAGQGMCSGIRDALDLAWKLAWVVTGRADDALLDTYVLERRAHVREVTEGAVFLGERLEASGPLSRWLRDVKLRLIGAAPALQARIRARGVRRPPLRSGLLAGASTCRGELFPLVRRGGDRAAPWLDDVIGYRGALIVRDAAVDDDTTAWAAAHDLALVRVRDDAEGAALRPWLDAHHVDGALVRPDRHVFAAAPARGLVEIRRAFDRAVPPAGR